MNNIFSTPEQSPPDTHIDLHFPFGSACMSKQLYADLDHHGYFKANDLGNMTLKNAVHSLLRREAFIDLAEAEYECIHPAVTLASRFICENAMIGFWTRIQHGKLVGEQTWDKGLIRKKPVTWLEASEFENTRKAIEQTKETMRRLADTLRVFTLDEKFPKVHPYTFAVQFGDELDVEMVYEERRHPKLDASPYDYKLEYSE